MITSKEQDKKRFITTKTDIIQKFIEIEIGLDLPYLTLEQILKKFMKYLKKEK